VGIPIGAQPGIDVSHYQSNVDWPTVNGAGYVYAFAKASEGVSTSDAYFTGNWPGIKAAGMLRGAYHYFDPTDDAKAQADFFLSCLANANGGSAVLAPGDLPCALDIEEADGVAPSDIIAGAIVWLQQVQTTTGRQPLVYTDPGFWSTIGNPTDLIAYPLWIAHLGVSTPTVPPGWPNWLFWQCDQQPVPGASGTPVVDLDAFNGTLYDLRTVAGYTATTETEVN
jgi:lysozyme